MYKIKPLRPFVRVVHKPLYVHHRLTALLLLFVVISGAAIPVLENYYHDKRYELNSQAQSLLGKANPNLTKKLTYDSTRQLFQFNKDVKKNMASNKNNPVAQLASKIGGAGKDDTQLYSVDAPKDLNQGVTYYENQMDLNFKITPLFGTMAGEQKIGHLVYPLQGTNGQVAYSVDAGALKENVLLYTSPGDSLSMSYKLDLPKSLEAKLDKDTGDLNVYSADPTLFADITYGSSDDRARVEAARNNGEKNYLAFKIPAPQIMSMGQTNQKSIAAVNSRFVYQNNILTVETTGLDKAQYPLSIDPSVSVDSTSDFQSGNIEDGNLNINSGSLSRSQITGGSIGSWNATNAMTSSVAEHTTVVSNGYIYSIGADGSFGTKVQHAPLFTNGTTGSWTATDTPIGPASLQWIGAAAYNGYIYVVGGYGGIGSDSSTVYVAKPASDGSISNWTTTAPMSEALDSMGVVAYNGYLYIVGGWTGSAARNTTRYIKINANGTLGDGTSSSWVLSGNTFTNAREFAGVAAYNGYLYIAGGSTNDANSGGLSDVQYTKLNKDGSIGAWNSAGPNFTLARQEHRLVIYNGYAYIIGGSSTSSAALNTVQYAQVNANGTLGAWTATNNFTNGRYGLTAVAYAGYLFIAGGGGAGGVTYSDVQSAKINGPGLTGSYTTSSSFTTARLDFGLTTYNGYMYVVGGNTNTNTRTNTVYYASINSTGGVGTWAPTATLVTPTEGLEVTAYNGYMYALGGYGNGGFINNSVQYAPINPNGTLGAWHYTHNSTDDGTSEVGGFATERMQFVAKAYNGYVYVMGGSTSGGVVNTVEYAPLNANGTVGSWTLANSFTTGRREFSGEIYGNYMYILGGWDGSGNYYNDVQYAPINSNGTLGTWNSAGTGFTLGREGVSSAVSDGYLYVVGGWDGVIDHDDVQYAPINSNGTLGTWNTAVSYSVARSNQESLAYAGNLYVIGGSGSSRRNDVQYASINSGGPGTAGAWHYTHNSTDDGTTFVSGFTNGRHGHVSVAYNGYLYVLGGYNGTTRYNDVQYAPINSNGTIGAWHYTHNSTDDGTTFVSGFTTGRYDFSAEVYNGYVYIIGGFGGSNLNDVQYAPINSNGTIGAWASTASFITARNSHESAVYNGYLYVTGGYNGSYLNDVQYAPINSNGTIGAWHYTHNSTDDGTTFVSGFTNGRFGHASIAYNGYLYVMGGDTGVNANDVQYAPINSNGTIGNWNTTTQFTNTRRYFSATALNGYLYVVGGDAHAAQNDVQYAPINSNGTIGNWSQTSSLIASRSEFALAVYGGYVYTLGGGPSDSNEVQYAPLNVLARKSLYTKTIDLGVRGKITGISYVGTLPGGNNSISYRVADTSGVFSSMRTSDILPGCTGQYIQLIVTLDDSQTSAAGDQSTTANTNLDSITVTNTITAPTNKRLRHGAFFNNEALQPLQTDIVCA
jgi:hypothetical protein